MTIEVAVSGYGVIGGLEAGEVDSDDGQYGGPRQGAAAVKLYDVGSGFARVHLSTRAERAAYLVLVCDRTRAWSAQEIARLKGVEEAPVERALAGFASAGIIEVEEGQPTSYRWSADMEYLFGTSENGAERIDPVCGMRVAADSPYFVKEADGASVWFCSPLCRAAFVAFPNSFALRGRTAQENDVRASIRGGVDR